MQGMSKSKCSIPISILTTYELINDGATHFKISKYIDNTKESKLFFQFIKSYEIKGVFYYVIETHYKKNKKPFSFIINTEAPLEQLSIFTPESKDSKTKTKTIFVGNAIANKEAIDIDKLPNILVNSYCIPFITTLRLTQISSIVNDNNYTFPLLDFLYFSAITITTVGYGDILPNCTLIRVLVMTEVFFGTIIIGVFISTLIKKNDTVS